MKLLFICTFLLLFIGASFAPDLPYFAQITRKDNSDIQFIGTVTDDSGGNITFVDANGTHIVPHNKFSVKPCSDPGDFTWCPRDSVESIEKRTWKIPVKWIADQIKAHKKAKKDLYVISIDADTALYLSSFRNEQILALDSILTRDEEGYYDKIPPDGP